MPQTLPTQPNLLLPYIQVHVLVLPSSAHIYGAPNICKEFSYVIFPNPAFNIFSVSCDAQPMHINKKPNMASKAIDLDDFINTILLVNDNFILP